MALPLALPALRATHARHVSVPLVLTIPKGIACDQKTAAILRICRWHPRIY